MNRTIKIIPGGATAVLHVNRQFIAMNAKDEGDRPVYTMKYRGETIYAREVEMNGQTKAVYNGTQLNCGARAWIECISGTFHLIDAQNFAEAKAAA
jgi:hypothetical protein